MEKIMDKLKVMTIVGTRPEIIRLSETIKKCDKYFNHILVHTGQNWDYALNEIFFEDLELRQPDIYLDAVGENLGETIGNIIAKSYKILMEIQPDALLILGDTNSALSAIAAKRLKIPIFHMEAGNRCFDENLPEETNRRIVDHIADVNLCYSEHARRYLNMEGTAKERTYVVGSPMAEVLSANLEKIRQSKVLDTLELESGRYILLSAHREENIDTERNFFALMDAVNAMAETYQIPVIYSVHPRSRKFIEARHFKFHPLVRTLQPFGFSDYNHLQMNAYCVVSDSGTLPEESSYFNRKGFPFPAVCVRTSTERPEAIDKGNFIIGSITTEQVLQAVDMAVEMRANEDDGVDVPDYIDENVSTKVVKIIQSYTGIVNKMVWRKKDV
jgi:UDP-N-acetylglucosamine 2-epimerase